MTEDLSLDGNRELLAAEKIFGDRLNSLAKRDVEHLADLRYRTRPARRT